MDEAELTGGSRAQTSILQSKPNAVPTHAKSSPNRKVDPALSNQQWRFGSFHVLQVGQRVGARTKCRPATPRFPRRPANQDQTRNPLRVAWRAESLRSTNAGEIAQRPPGTEGRLEGVPVFARWMAGVYSRPPVSDRGQDHVWSQRVLTFFGPNSR